MKPRLFDPPELPPRKDSAIVATLQDAGYGVERIELGEVYRKMMSMLGHYLRNIDVIRREDMLRLLSDAQVRKGRAFTPAQLKAIADPRRDAEAFYGRVQELLSHGGGVFLRGYEIECPNCRNRHFYIGSIFDEWMFCPGCRAQFQPPLQAEFHYKINELFAKGLKNGALTVLFSLRKMDVFCKDIHKLHWYSGYQLRKDGQTFDVDLIVDCKGALTLFECKDNLPQDEAPLLAQLEQTMRVAQAIDADFRFSTLASEVPAATADLLKEHKVWLRVNLLS